MKSRAVIVVVLMMLSGGRAAYAQSGDTLGFSSNMPRWVGQFTTLSANAALGAVTAGIIQRLHGGSFKDGFVRGALGGTVIYAGKRVAAERFFAAGLTGREIAATGASLVRNASQGVGSLDRLVLPVGIVKVYWNRPARNVAVHLDAIATGYTVYGVVEKELHFDAHETFSSGAPVFKTDDKVITSSVGEHSAGVQAEGVVFRAVVPPWGNEFLERALAHERMHILQDDQLFITWNQPLEHWAFAKTSPTNTLAKYVDINVSTESLRQLARFLKHDDRPWEIEAIYLTR